MDEELNKNWLETIKSSFDICNALIDMQIAEIQDILFKQEDKVIIEDESYEAGIEFCGVPNDAIKKLEDYISWKLKDKLSKKRLSPIDSGDLNTVETKEQPPIKSSDINTVETKRPVAQSTFL